MDRSIRSTNALAKQAPFCSDLCHALPARPISVKHYRKIRLLACSLNFFMFPVLFAIIMIFLTLGLCELGQLEHDLVFGDAGAKDVINFLRTK